MQSKAKTIDAFLEGVADSKRPTLKELHALVMKHAPTAVGSMKYGMPTYEVADRMIAFNAQKHHFSFYADPEILDDHRAALKSHSLGKSCIRFRKLEPELKRTLEQIVQGYVDRR